MNDIVMGRVLRALRRRRGWRQVDLAERSGVSQSHVSAVERGHAETSSLRVIRRLFAAVEARTEVVASWRGADLERLLDEDHAQLVAAVARRLEAMGWRAELEVTYSEYGERGSIDVLGLRAAERACLVVEVKTTIASSEAVGRKLDEKARLAPRIVERRSGWRPEAVGRALVLPETMRLRRLVNREEALRRMFPASIADLRRWFRRPSGAIAGLWFLSDSIHHAVGGSRTVRIRVPGAAGKRHRAVGRGSSQVERAADPPKTSGTAER